MANGCALSEARSMVWLPLQGPGIQPWIHLYSRHVLVMKSTWMEERIVNGVDLSSTAISSSLKV